MPRTRAHPPAAPRQRKTLDLDQPLLDEARRVLGAPSETETVRLALERVVRNRHFADRIRSLGSLGLVIDRARVEE
jgi:Arc/MetJ family transcription regulator